MSNLTVSNQNSVLPVQKTTVKPAVVATLKSEDPAMLQDEFKLQRGLMPTLKGAGAGAGGSLLVGGGMAALTYGIIKSAGGAANGTGFGAGLMAVGVFGAGVGAAVAGSVGGAVAANTSDRKSLGALAGAASGALLVGGITLALTRSAGTAAMMAAPALAAGGIGGFFGSMVAERK